MFEILHYVTAGGEDVMAAWLDSLGDLQARARIAARIERLRVGNFGDCKPCRDGVWELRVDWGPGYRVYYARTGRTLILLLTGGDKRRQRTDIERAIDYFSDYERRTT